MVRYYLDGQAKTQRGFTTKKAAQLWDSNRLVDTSKGGFVDPARGKVKIDTLAARYFAGVLWKGGSARTNDSAWRNHVQPKWGNRAASGIKPSEVQAWLGGLSKTHSRATVSRCRGVLAGILDVAVHDRLLATNPARGAGVKVQRGSKVKAQTFLTHEQVFTLAKECDTAQHQLEVLTLAYTGLRYGELAALRVKHLDFKARLVLVRGTVAETFKDGVRGLHIGTPKDHEVRDVPAPAFLMEELKAFVGERESESMLFLTSQGSLARPPSSHDSWLSGAVARCIGQSQEARDKAKKAEKPLPDLFPRVTAHDLRHTAASLAVDSGANVLAVQLMLGHASSTTTLDTYSALFPNSSADVAVRMNDEVSRRGLRLTVS